MLEARITKRVNEDGSAVKAYAELVVDNCAIIRGIRLMDGKNGSFVCFPQEPAYDTETKAPKVNEDGKPVYQDIIFPESKEVRDAVLEVLLKAYSSEKGTAELEDVANNHTISVKMYEAHGETVKASGSVEVGDFVCRNVLVSLKESERTGKNFAAVSYPSYKRDTEFGTEYVPFFELKKDGKEWNAQNKITYNKNYESLAYNLIVKAAKEVSAELALGLDAQKPDMPQVNAADIPLNLNSSHSR